MSHLFLRKFISRVVSLTALALPFGPLAANAAPSAANLAMIEAAKGKAGEDGAHGV